jgi:hypothetical protein
MSSPEVLRMLETGVLSAVLRAELTAADGTPIGFDYALLPPEGVARVIHEGGDDLELEWSYAYESAKAVSRRARIDLIRVLFP